ncbi:MAG: hypothetical protein WC724_03555 [Candidatus Paceibacterota bacterium]|jgi:hypothetical protein
MSNNNTVNTSNNPYSLPFAVERLTEALYMVTGLFDEGHIKDKIRINALETLSLSHELPTLPLSLRHEVVLEMEYLMKEVEALLRVSLSNGFISQMNATLLLDEYKKIREKMSHRDFVFSTDSTKLEKSFFFSKDGEVELLGGENISDQNKNTQENSSFIKDTLKDNTKDRFNVLLSDKKIKPDASVKRHAISDNKNKDRSDRRDLILRIIRKNKDSTIKDISTMVSGCSEKTIQRELIALVSENVLKKTGEKRWTRYFLA